MTPVVIGDARLYLGDKRKRTGADHPLFRGGKTKGYGGYVVISCGPNAGRREHRVVMEVVLGRPLLESEIVHHINGDKTDNRPENLSIETRASHNREHGKGALIGCCDCGKQRWYSPSELKKAAGKSSYRCRTCWTKAGGNAKCMNAS